MATRESSGGGQERASRRSSESDAEVDTIEDVASSDVQERHGKLTDDVDSLLDEIDDVLEENAEEFVKSYVQKGGQ